MIKKLSLSVLVTLGLVSGAIAQTIEWSAGQVGGGWFGQASGMAAMVMKDHPELNIRVVPGGGTANPTKVERNVSQIGTGLDIFLFAAYNGTGIYAGKQHKQLRLIGMSFSDIYIHLVAAKNAPYQDMESLFRKGKNVSIAVTKAGSSDAQTFEYLMEYYGTSYDDLRSRGWKVNRVEYSSAASQFGDGVVDYAFVALGTPGAAVVEMLQSRAGGLMPFAPNAMASLAKKYGYTAKPFAKGTYKGQDVEVPTLIMATALMANATVPEITIYNVLKTFCEHQSELVNIHASIAVFDCKTAAGSRPAPLHPGAEKYLKEKGYL